MTVARRPARSIVYNTHAQSLPEHGAPFSQGGTRLRNQAVSGDCLGAETDGVRRSSKGIKVGMNRREG
jgi:hypothetical protein